VPAARSPAVEIFLWSRAAIWAAALFALLVFEPNRHPEAARWDDPAARWRRARAGGRRSQRGSIRSLLRGVAVVQWALWQWVA
jgi:hypothetical protein